LGVTVWSLSSWPSVRCLPEGSASDSAGRFVTPPHQDTVRGVARGRFPCRGGRQRRHAMRCRLLGDFNFAEAPATPVPSGLPDQPRLAPGDRHLDEAAELTPRRLTDRVFWSRSLAVGCSLAGELPTRGTSHDRE